MSTIRASRVLSSYSLGFIGFVMGRVMGVCCSLMGSLGGFSGGVLGLDNVSESEVSFVDACVAGGCRSWV